MPARQGPSSAIRVRWRHAAATSGIVRLIQVFHTTPGNAVKSILVTSSFPLWLAQSMIAAGKVSGFGIGHALLASESQDRSGVGVLERVEVSPVNPAPPGLDFEETFGD